MHTTDDLVVTFKQFIQLLREGKIYRDDPYFLNATGLGKQNSEALCARIESVCTDNPTIQQTVDSWIYCRQHGLVVYMQTPPSAPTAQPVIEPEPSGPTMSAQEEYALEMVRELKLMKLQKRQEAPLNPENEVFTRLKQADQDDETIKELRSDCMSAQSKVSYKFGVTDYSETNRLRTAELLRLQNDYCKKFPKLAARIGEEVGKAAQGMGLQLVKEMPLPASPTEAQIRAASPEEIRRWRARQRNKQNGGTNG